MSDDPASIPILFGLLRGTSTLSLNEKINVCWYKVTRTQYTSIVSSVVACRWYYQLVFIGHATINVPNPYTRNSIVL